MNSKPQVKGETWSRGTNSRLLFGVNAMLRAVFTWLSKGIGFGFGFGFTTPFGWLVYLLWFWFYDSQVKTALIETVSIRFFMKKLLQFTFTQQNGLPAVSYLWQFFLPLKRLAKEILATWNCKRVTANCSLRFPMKKPGPSCSKAD